MNPKLMHEPVSNCEGKPEQFVLTLSNVPRGTGWYKGSVRDTFMLCTNCRTVYQTQGDDHGVCPARLHDMLKEHVL